MSDSDSDLYLNNVFPSQNSITTFRVKGPNINATNKSHLPIRSNEESINMQRNFARSRYAESFCDQRSLNYRRETSPMSMSSVPGVHSRNVQNFLYQGGSSYRSTYNGRSGSPMSIRTVDSNASIISSADIAQALQNNNFNKHDIRVIRDAFFKYMKSHNRRRIEKRRNKRLFQKGRRRKSGYDSGEQGSESSISSDDCHSIRSSKTVFKENSVCSSMSTRSFRTDISKFRKVMQESNMYTDCTNTFRKSAFKNIAAVTLKNSKENSLSQTKSTLIQGDRFRNSFLFPSQRFDQSVASSAIHEHLNVQRTGVLHSRNENIANGNYRPSNNHLGSESEQEQIFSEEPTKNKSIYKGRNCQSKRSLDVDVCPTSSKKFKLSSPQKNMKSKEPNKIQATTTSKKDKNINDFVFTKPVIPIKKTDNTRNQTNVGTKPQLDHSSKQRASTSLQSIKPQLPKKIAKQLPVTEEKNRKSVPPPKIVIAKAPDLPEQINAKQFNQCEERISQEILISKSSQPLDTEKLPNNNPAITTHGEKKQHSQSEDAQNFTTDVSMRPSFIKRKLFTQKVDVETKNTSSDSITSDCSQSTMYSAIQREKNKTRKLVTSQSCLSRDILGDDNNLIDLIHKIVPPDQMNVTTATNKTDIVNKSKAPNAEKWDVSTVIAECNDDNISDTYTDEEIFEASKNNVKLKEKEKIAKINNVKLKEKEKIAKTKVDAEQENCHVLVPRLATEVEEVLQENLQKKTVKENFKEDTSSDLKKQSMYKCVKSFWDTDVESDMEMPKTPRIKLDSTQDCRGTEKQRPGLENEKSNNIKNTTLKTTNSKLEQTRPVNIEIKTNGKNEKCNIKSSKDNPTIHSNSSKVNNNTANTTLNQKQRVIKLAGKSQKKLVLMDTSDGIDVLNQTKPDSNKNVRKNYVKSTQISNKKMMSKEMFSNNELSTLHVNNNNTLRMKSRKVDHVQRKNTADSDQSINNSQTALRHLRSRTIDLSSSMNSDKGTPLNKKVTKRNKIVNKNINKTGVNTTSGDKSQLSDMSFTLPVNESVVLTRRRAAANESCMFNSTRTTRRNVSSLLISDKQHLKKNTTANTKSRSNFKEARSVRNNYSSHKEVLTTKNANVEKVKKRAIKK